MSLTTAEVTALKALLRKAPADAVVPPWLLFPELPVGSVFWRMAPGEGPLCSWIEWLTETLTAEERALYRRGFPAPRSWCVHNPDYYDTIEETFGSTANETTAEETPLTPEQGIADGVGVTLWTPDGKPSVCSRALLVDEGREANVQRDFVFFWGHSRKKNGNSLGPEVLSQWWQQDPKASPPSEQFSVTGTGSFMCAEQYMMFWKAKVFDDEATCDRILEATDPATIKQLGREVKGWDPDVWSTVAFSIVAQGNYYKFNADPARKAYLLGTGDAVLVEASPHDTVWGIGRSVAGAAKAGVDLKDARQWRGDNLLGFALMEVREELRRVYRHAPLLKEFGH